MVSLQVRYMFDFKPLCEPFLPLGEDSDAEGGDDFEASPVTLNLTDSTTVSLTPTEAKASPWAADVVAAISNVFKGDRAAHVLDTSPSRQNMAEVLGTFTGRLKKVVTEDKSQYPYAGRVVPNPSKPVAPIVAPNSPGPASPAPATASVPTSQEAAKAIDSPKVEADTPKPPVTPKPPTSASANPQPAPLSPDPTPVLASPPTTPSPSLPTEKPVANEANSKESLPSPKGSSNKAQLEKPSIADSSEGPPKPSQPKSDPSPQSLPQPTATTEPPVLAKPKWLRNSIWSKNQMSCTIGDPVSPFSWKSLSNLNLKRPKNTLNKTMSNKGPLSV